MTSRLKNAIDLIKYADKFPQKTEIWLKARNNTISASEVQSIILEKPMWSTYNRFIIKKAWERLGVRKFRGNKYTRFGVCFEPVARSIYMKKVNPMINNICNFLASKIELK